MGAINNTRAAALGKRSPASRAGAGPERAQAWDHPRRPSASVGGMAMWAMAHAQAGACPWGQGVGESSPGIDSTATHCMPEGVQISATGPPTTAGTTSPPKRPCSAENTVHSNTHRSHRGWWQRRERANKSRDKTGSYSLLD